MCEMKRKKRNARRGEKSSLSGEIACHFKQIINVVRVGIAESTAFLLIRLEHDVLVEEHSIVALVAAPLQLEQHARLERLLVERQYLEMLLDLRQVSSLYRPFVRLARIRMLTILNAIGYLEGNENTFKVLVAFAWLIELANKNLAIVDRILGMMATVERR